MNLQQYVPLALRTEKPFPTAIDRLVHAAIGIDTETGEINTVIKRVAIYGKSLDAIGDKEKNLTFRQCAGEEIGDVAWYIAIAIDAIKADANEIAPFPGLVASPLLGDLALELSTVSGRFADVILYAKKQGRVELLPNERIYIMNTLANLLRVLYGACAALGLELGDLLDHNIAKLRERFPDAYSDEAAEARADKGGLDARNS